MFRDSKFEPMNVFVEDVSRRESDSKSIFKGSQTDLEEVVERAREILSCKLKNPDRHN